MTDIIPGSICAYNATALDCDENTFNVEQCFCPVVFLQGIECILPSKKVVCVLWNGATCNLAGIAALIKNFDCLHDWL